jgi:hypothetical protein
MAASLGIWNVGNVADGVIFRWVADDGRDDGGFVLLRPESMTLRPWDGSDVIGDLTADGTTGQLTGEADGVDRTLFAQVAGSILRACARSGEVPQTAHAYFS